MNCFIASAFDYDDIDAIYDKAIRPVLKEFKIRPVRVDRDEHNDDIDDRIFQLIDQSQLCLADLTHARPSVYYEAGYAFGKGKPVIYIVRHDHFRPRGNDPAGNLRVHFDLQMKNIIPWTEPNDTFKQKLRSRVRLVTKPLLQKIQIADEKEKFTKTFNTLSLFQQMDAIQAAALNIIQGCGYSDNRIKEKRAAYHYDYNLLLEKTCGSTYRQIHLFVRDGITKAEMLQLYFSFRIAPIKKDYNLAKRIETACIFISLRPARMTTLRGLLANWSPQGERVFTCNDHSGAVPINARIIVIDGVQSVNQFSKKLQQELKAWGE